MLFRWTVGHGLAAMIFIAPSLGRFDPVAPVKGWVMELRNLSKEGQGLPLTIKLATAAGILWMLAEVAARVI